MATITSITVTYGRVVPLAPYANVTISTTISADLDPLDNEAEVSKALHKMAKLNVLNGVAAYKPNLEPEVRNKFMGLDVEDTADEVNHAN